MDDLIITNARIVDGTGRAAFDGDIAVRNDRIIEVAERGSIQREATRIIDARGHLVTPGFVDIHTHFDGQVCLGQAGHAVELARGHDGRDGELRRGLCTGASGFRGRSRAVDGERRGHSRHRTPRGHSVGLGSFGDYLDAIDTPYVMDIGAQVPHVALRLYVMGTAVTTTRTPMTSRRWLTSRDRPSPTVRSASRRRASTDTWTRRATWFPERMRRRRR